MTAKPIPAYMVVQQTLISFLEPLQTFLPEVAAAALQALDAGGAPEKAGQVLATGLQGYLDNLGATYVEKEKQMYAQIQELEQEHYKKIRETIDDQNTIKSLEEEINKIKMKTIALQEIIQNQNRVLAAQHKKLISYYGS